MKKKLLSAAIFLAAIFSFNASASAQTPDNQNVTEQTSKQDKKADKKDKKDKKNKGDKKDRKAGKEGKGGRHGQRPDLFKGIELTAEQQAQLDALRPRCPEGAPKKDANLKCNEAKCDSALCAKADGEQKCCKADFDKKGHKGSKGEGARQGHRPHMGKGMREEYVNKVKEILTPEQFEVFQKNIAELRENAPGRPDKK